jgi:chromosome segregation ATPase
MVSDKAQINFTVERDAKELAKEKLEYGELSTELRETIQRIAFGEEISKREQSRKRLAELRDAKDKKRSEIREAEAELEQIEDEIARVEERLDGMERREDKYEASLEMLEESLRSGQRVFEDHGQVIKAAKIGGMEPEDVIEELKDRNPMVPDHAFVSGMHVTEDWNGVVGAEDTGDSSR